MHPKLDFKPKGNVTELLTYLPLMRRCLNSGLKERGRGTLRSQQKTGQSPGRPKKRSSLLHGFQSPHAKWIHLEPCCYWIPLSCLYSPSLFPFELPYALEGVTAASNI
ncbi:hypothetical protein KIL84_015497 [Mauremys mutica]|uniref:Uncharacterized protein n=1 Tax=Mauremys mutica TaxID=74926 RepID=A0A9D3WSK0_9SAUR|nr:hypothetical protein KIL84_015497 [Mauremys mutica]